MRLFVGAGEASGDRMLAPVLRSLRARIPDLRLHGFGGPLCAAEGLDSLAPIDAIAVNGIGDVLRRAPSLLRARARLHRELHDFHHDLVLLADYPGMNVGLARDALRMGTPVHYIAPPQLWAYRNPARRLKRLHAALRDASLQVLFPFEADVYAPWNGRLCQGHFFNPPAAEDARGDRLLLCPGSRRGVLRRNLPLWLEHLASTGMDMDTVDILVPPPLAEEARAIAAGVPNRKGEPWLALTGPTAAFARAGRAIAFPGTITLELFLRRIPTRAWGILDPLTLWAGRRLVRGPHVSLPNLLAGRGCLPEWIGTAGDFRRTPPTLPDSWDPPDEISLRDVWAKMGPDAGVEQAVTACMEMAAAGRREGFSR